MSDWVATDYPGYFVDRDGRVLGPRGRVLRATIRGKGYPSVRVADDRTPYVHELVCTAFHGPRPTPRHQVAHGNGVPADNRAENLRWVLPAENTADAVRHGTFPLLPGGAGERNGNAVLTRAQVEAMRREYAAGGVTQQALATRYGIGKSQVHNIVRGKQWLDREEWRP